MKIYARVNILGGLSVRLPHGGLDEAIALDNDPIGRARNWAEQGVDFMHIVDLDAAAYGDQRNKELIDQLIAEVEVPVQVAGGIRSESGARHLIEQGAWRIVMGTAAIENQNMVWDLCRENPGKIVVSLDVRQDEEVATRGWTQNSGRYLEEVLIEMSSAGVAAFLVAEAGRDALEEPPNLRILAEALATVEEPVIAAGGVRDLDDLRTLVRLESSGRMLDGVIVGREVTAGRFTIGEAKQVIAGGGPKRAPGGVAALAVSLDVSSLEASLGFYTDLLGFAPVRTPDLGVAAAVVQAGRGQQIELVESSDSGRPSRLTISVEELDRWREHLANVGIEAESSDTVVEIRDPDGTVIRFQLD
jgi:phosphoribosylformimino-5-aminoimidazole carboxamide ribotide isomerase